MEAAKKQPKRKRKRRSGVDATLAAMHANTQRLEGEIENLRRRITAVSVSNSKLRAAIMKASKLLVPYTTGRLG